MTPEDKLIPSKVSVQDFAKRLRTKYPDAYQDIDDVDLVEKTIRKHPVYADSVELPEGFSILGKATSGYQKLDSIYEQAARAHNVPGDLLIEQGRHETINFKPEVMYGKLNSPAGARGAGQFMKGTAPKYELTVNNTQDDRTDPIKSINAQAKYMRKLLDDFDDNEDLALAGYNAGEYRESLKAGKIPNIKETQVYVKTIRDKIKELRKHPSALRELLGTQAIPTNPTPQPLQSGVQDLENYTPKLADPIPDESALLPSERRQPHLVPEAPVNPLAGISAIAPDNVPDTARPNVKRENIATKKPIAPKVKGEVSVEIPSDFNVVTRDEGTPIGAVTKKEIQKQTEGQVPFTKSYTSKPTGQQLADDSAVAIYGEDIKKVNGLYEQITGKKLITPNTADEDVQWDAETGQVNAVGEVHPYVQDLVRAYQRGGESELKARLGSDTKNIPLSTPEDIKERKVKEIANPSDEDIAQQLKADRTPIPDVEYPGGNPVINSWLTKGFNLLTGRDGKEITPENIAKYRKEELLPESDIRAAMEQGESVGAELGAMRSGISAYQNAVLGLRKITGLEALDNMVKSLTGVDTGGKFAKELKQSAQYGDLVSHFSRMGDNSYLMDARQAVARLPLDLSRYFVVSKIPGLSGGTAMFAADNLLQSIGKSENLTKNLQSAETGAMLGATLGAAGKLGEGVLKVTGSKILKELATLSGIGGGVMGAETLMGAKSDEAFRAAVNLMALHFVNKVPEAAGHAIKYVKDGKEVVAVATPEKVTEVELMKGEKPEGVIDLSKVTEAEWQRLGGKVGALEKTPEPEIAKGQPNEPVLAVKTQTVSEGEFVPSGEVKRSRAPVTLRENEIPVEDRFYTSATNPEQKEFADKQLDKGVEHSQKWLDEQIANDNPNNGATTIVGIALMNKYGKEGDIASLNKVADKIVPMLTEQGQSIQAMSTVSMYSPESAATFATKVKKQKTGKDLTPAEANRATALARDLSETAQAEGIGRAMESQANQKLTELTKEIKSLKAEPIRQKLEEAQSQIEQLRKDAPYAPEVLRKAEQIVQQLEKRAETARERLKKRGNVFTSGLDPVALKDFAEIGASHIGRVGLNFAKWSTEMVKEFGEGVKKHLDEIWDKSQKVFNTGSAGLGMTPEKRLEIFKKRAESAIKDLEGKIEKGDFSKPSKEKTLLDAEAKTLRNKRTELREIFNKGGETALIAKVGKDKNYSDDAVDFAVIRKNTQDVNEAIKAFEKSHPDSQVRKAMIEANNLLKEVTFAKDAMRIQAENEVTLTEKQVKQIQDDRSLNRREAIKAARDATRFYTALSQTTGEIALDTGIGFTKAGLLTAPKTHMINILSNAGFGAAVEIERLPAFAVDRLASLATGEKTVQGINPTSLFNSFKNIVVSDAALKNADRPTGFQKAKEILLYGDTESNMKKVQHTESVLGEKFRDSKIAQKLGIKNQWLNPGKWVDNYINGVFRTLGAEDALFKVYAFRRALEEQASTIARTEKLHNKDLDVTKRQRELLESPTEVMKMEADAYADYLTFQNDNMLSTWIRRLKGTHPAVKAVTDFLVPFDRTPTNIVMRTLEYSPYGLAKGLVHAKNMVRPNAKKARATSIDYRSAVKTDLKADPEFQKLSDTEKLDKIELELDRVFTRHEQREFARLFGRGTLGTGLFALGALLASKGLMVGADSPSSDKDRESQEETDIFFERKKAGIENNSILIPGFGRIVLPQTPPVKYMNAGANFYETFARSKQSDPVMQTWKGVGDTTEDIIFDQPLLRSTADLVQKAKGQKYGEFAGNLAARIVPASSLVREIGEVGDSKARQSSGYKQGQNLKTSKGFLAFQGRGLKNTVLHGIPGARTYTPESTAAPSAKERNAFAGDIIEQYNKPTGGALRRLARMFDPLNTRRPVESGKP